MFTQTATALESKYSALKAEFKQKSDDRPRQLMRALAWRHDVQSFYLIIFSFEAVIRCVASELCHEKPLDAF